ncbi:hypothetical protein CMV_008270 [Castanea mollissima]|uniref:Uncharacterized protein n=1 Tax=Castanea mollissima TaxID=60419 RepID=A0A8J4VPG9_9ROSI|nr:hypothetical protein CMV_008270 [Castanea mollissima]
MLASQNKYPFKGRCVHVFNEQVGSFQNIDDSFWVSLISGLILSILDVAPLNIVGRYMDDVYTAVQDYQHCPVKSSSDAPFERESLFPLPSFPLSTKKKSVALVPKEIVKLAQRFISFFNPSLFPHKPPSAAVVNRALFTDAEDELLALGLMEYNTDWKAIPVSSMQIEASGSS